MTRQVFYQKWRPQTLAEVVGQQHITRTLANALASDRVAHAYLFCGPRGTGKTSTGRILAKAVNCLSNGRGDPCNQCQICTAINEGRDLDLVEIDAASNTGVDDIRKLRENVNYSPDLGKYKIYIIDEVHMLSNSAFNALLKTLEEPPQHVIFVLATTEIHKIPATVLSRCQRFDFRRISQKAIADRLKQICRGEGIDIDAHALSLIARAATGSLRDAENLLERLSISCQSSITTESVQEMLGISGDVRAGKLVKSLLSRDVPAAVSIVHGISEDGLNLQQFAREVTEYLRGVLMIKIGSADTLDLDAATIDEMRQTADESSPQDILTALKLFGKVNIQSHGPSTLPLEMAVAEFSLPGTQLPRAEHETSKPDAETVKQKKAKPADKKDKQTRNEKAIKAASLSGAGSATTIKESVSASKEQPVSGDTASVPLSERNLEFFQKHWKAVVQSLRGVGSTGNMDALLRSACDPVALEDNTIVLGFYYPFHKEKIEDPKYRRFVEQAISNVFGAEYKVRCVLTPKEQPKQTLIDAAIQMGAEIVNDDTGGNN